MEDLFIGGGGYSGIMFIGVLEYLHENNLLDIKNFYGCSIGSLIGILYLSGYTPKEILSKFMDINLKDIVKYDFNNLSNLEIVLNLVDKRKQIVDKKTHIFEKIQILKIL
jgi:predicted acylesterase/phospholipase RssA